MEVKVGKSEICSFSSKFSPSAQKIQPQTHLKAFLHACRLKVKVVSQLQTEQDGFYVLNKSEILKTFSQTGSMKSEAADKDLTRKGGAEQTSANLSSNLTLKWSQTGSQPWSR